MLRRWDQTAMLPVHVCARTRMVGPIVFFDPWGNCATIGRESLKIIFQNSIGTKRCIPQRIWACGPLNWLSIVPMYRCRGEKKDSNKRTHTQKVSNHPHHHKCSFGVHMSAMNTTTTTTTTPTTNSHFGILLAVQLH